MFEQITIVKNNFFHVPPGLRKQQLQHAIRAAKTVSEVFGYQIRVVFKFTSISCGREGFKVKMASCLGLLVNFDDEFNRFVSAAILVNLTS